MTFAQIKTRVSKGVQRDDLAADYGTIVLEALMEIQRKRSWQAMKTLGDFTIHSGASSVALATDDNSATTRFKELTIEKSPVHLQTGLDSADPVLVPCDVWTREKVLRRQSRLISNSILYSLYIHPNTARRVSIPIFMTGVEETATLNVLFAAESDLPFSVSYFAYLPDLVADGDTNYFTTKYPEMVIAKAKAIAFEAINDPMSEDFETVFMARFKEAAAQDAYQAVAGLELRM